MDFRFTKSKAMDDTLPLNLRRAYIILCIESSWGNICFETILNNFSVKYNLWDDSLSTSQINQMIDDLSWRREKSVLIEKQFQLYSDWKSKKGLNLVSAKGTVFETFFDRRIEQIWEGLLA